MNRPRGPLIALLLVPMCHVTTTTRWTRGIGCAVARETTALPRGFVAAAGTLAVALLALSVVIFARPFGTAGDVAAVDLIETGFPLAGAAGCAVAVSRNNGRLRRAWVCLMLACASWGVGQAIWTVYEVGLGHETPFPSLADVGYLGFAVAAVPALWLLPSRSHAGDNRRRLLDGLTAACAVTLISWATVLGPAVRAGGQSRFALAVSVAYPISDILILTVALLALAQGSRHRVSLIVVSLGMCAMAVSDGGFAYLAALDAYAAGSPVDLGWSIAFVAFALGGMLSSEPDEVSRGDGRTVVSASVLPYVPVAVAAVVVLSHYIVNGTFDSGSVTLTCVLVALVLARQYATVRDNQVLTRTLTLREAELRHRAFHDGLTGLANRTLFTDRVAHALELHLRDRRPVSVAFIDLDGFKGINDTLGHAAGDEILVQVAERLRLAVRGADTLARFGGDEFALLMEHGHNPAVVARTLVDSLRAPFDLRGRSVAVSASVGVASVRDDEPGTSVQNLLSRADVAMYAVKRSGRNNFRLHTPDLRLAMVDDLELSQALAEALAAGAIRAEFQPIVNLRTGSLIGYEALARWTHQGQQIPPEVFVPVAERVGLVATLTSLMLDHACAQLEQWSTELGFSALTVSVNVSRQELGDASLPQRVLSALDTHRLSADRLTLEVTESALVRDPAAAHAAFATLRELGVSISLDDFGTGYSGFAQLIGVPMDSVKLDQRFIAEIDTDPYSKRLLEGVISLTHHLGLRVIAEGVERPEQLDVLRALDCDEVQGFLVGRPLDARNLDALTGAAPTTATSER